MDSVSAPLSRPLLLEPRTAIQQGYTPSEPAETGTTNILARFGALNTYVNDQLEAAGGDSAPECFRDCLTVQINNILGCLDQKNTYATSESCEKDAAQQAAQCDPQMYGRLAQFHDSV